MENERKKKKEAVIVSILSRCEWYDALTGCGCSKLLGSFIIILFINSVSMLHVGGPLLPHRTHGAARGSAVWFLRATICLQLCLPLVVSPCPKHGPQDQQSIVIDHLAVSFSVTP